MILAVDILQEIRKAESRAEYLKMQAVSKAKDIVREASNEGERILNNASEEAKELALRIIKEWENEGNKQAAVIMKQAEEECSAIESLDEDKLEKAVNLVLERIVNPNGDI